MTRVAAYCRVSTDMSDQINSFNSQKRFFQEYIGSREDWMLYAIYSDEGITGTTATERAGFMQMISDALEGKFDLILTKEVSRFSRNLLDTVAYTRQLKCAGVGVIFLSDGISTLDPDAELRLGIMASVAQEESRRTSERVKWGQRRQMERGVVFGRSLLGYELRGGQLFVEPKGAEIVRLIYHMYLHEGMGVRKIAAALARQDIPTSTGNAVWSGAAVLKILRNEKYCGDLYQGKTITADYLTHKKVKNKENMIFLKDHHEPIVSKADWEAVQAELSRRSSCDKSSKPCGNRFVLSGKVLCAACGAVCICRTRKRRNGSTYRVWQRRCRCEGKPRQLREDDLLLCIRQIVAGFDAQRLLEGFHSVLTRAKGRPDEEMSEVAVMLATAENKLFRLVDAYIAGDVGRDAYLMLRKNLDDNMRVLRERLLHMEASGCENAANPITDIAEVAALGEDLDNDLYLSLIEALALRSDGSIDIRLYGLSEPLHAVYR